MSEPTQFDAKEEVIGDRMLDLILAIGTCPFDLTAQQEEEIDQAEEALRHGSLVICRRQGRALSFEVRPKS